MTIRTKNYEYGQEEMDYLTTVDEVLGMVITRLGKVERVITPDLFSSLVRAIVGQLISVKSANTVWGRLLNLFGEITPHRLSIHSPDDIQSCGMSMKKARCIHSIAQKVESGEFNLEELTNLSDAEVIKRLTSLDGIGQWTAEMLLIHSMERRDIVSWGDMGIRRGMMKLYGLDSLTKQQFEQYRRIYSPHGTVSSIYLWEISNVKVKLR